MAKTKVTRKSMKEQFGKKLVFVPDGTMQIFASVISPTYYSTRSEGWACDYYIIDDLCINEGYDPTGKRAMNYEECQPFRNAYDDIKRRYLGYEKERILIQNLFDDFVGTINEKIERGEVR